MTRKRQKNCNRKYKNRASCIPLAAKYDEYDEYHDDCPTCHGTILTTKVKLGLRNALQFVNNTLVILLATLKYSIFLLSPSGESDKMDIFKTIIIAKYIGLRKMCVFSFKIGVIIWSMMRVVCGHMLMLVKHVTFCTAAIPIGFRRVLYCQNAAKNAGEDLFKMLMLVKHVTFCTAAIPIGFRRVLYCQNAAKNAGEDLFKVFVFYFSGFN
uniref:Uncharacterized protein n=1 Tax=Glossina austeni TaxID=7395 RepID=A0A1A9UEF6_GLOAU